MKYLHQFMTHISNRFDAWLSKVGKENRPLETDNITYPEDEPLIGRADLLADERGDNWYEK